MSYGDIPYLNFIQLIFTVVVLLFASLSLSLSIKCINFKIRSCNYIVNLLRKKEKVEIKKQEKGEFFFDIEQWM